MTKRTMTAAIIGVAGGVATIVGPALPWLTYTGPAFGADPSLAPSGFEAGSITGLSLDPFALFFGIALTAAAAWLWAGTEPRKAGALLGPVSLAVATICVLVMVKKEAALYGGFGGSSEETDLAVGLFVTLAGAVAGLIAAAIAAWPVATVREGESTEAVETAADRPTDLLPDAPD